MNETQEKWPFGPAPERACSGGGEHEWRVIDLLQAADPPAPSFECVRCRYRWSRGWTKGEFRRVILKGTASDPYYGDGSHYPDEPPYREVPR